MSLNVFSRIPLLSFVKIALLIFTVASLSSCGKVSGGLKGASSESSVTLTTDQSTLTLTEGSSLEPSVLLSALRKKDTDIQVTLTTPENNVNSRFLGFDSSLKIPSGSLIKKIALNTIDNNTYEGTQTFTLSFSSLDDKVKDAKAVTTIILNDNDAPPTLAINDQTSVNESGSLTFTVTLTGSTTVAATVAYSIGGGTATAGTDYTAATGTLSFPVGTTTQTIIVPITSDSIQEPNETFNITLASPTHATISDGTGVGTITDDEAVTVQFTLASQSVSESAGTATVVLQLSGVTSTNVVVPFTLTGTATGGGGNDYTITASPVTITAGQTTVNVVATISDDATVELDETIIATIGSPTGATANGTTVHTITITNNDSAGFNLTGITGAADAALDADLNGGIVPKVNWGADAAAASYDITIYESDGTTVKCSTQNTTNVDYTFSSCSGGAFVAGTSYKAKVIAKNSGGTQIAEAGNSPYDFLVNRAPAAGNDVYFVMMNNNLTTVDPRGNDTDADSHSLSITAVTNGAQGTVTFTATSVTYTSNASSFTGADTFTYTISDGHGATSVGTVTVYNVTAYTWTGDTDSNWNTSANWCGAVNGTNTACTGGGTVPGAGNTAIFDATCTHTGYTCASNINANISVAGLKLNSGYTGTLTQDTTRTITIGTSGYVQDSGSFLGSDANITISGSMNVSGVTSVYRATSATLQLGRALSIGSIGSFSANGGLLLHKGAANTTHSFNTGTNAFNNVSFYHSCSPHDNVVVDFASNMSIDGNLVLDSAGGCGAGGLNNGTLIVKGDISAIGTGTAFFGTTVFKVAGSTNQTLSTSSATRLLHLEIASTGGTVLLSGSLRLHHGFEYTSGNVDTTGSTVTFIPKANTVHTLKGDTVAFNNVTFIQGCGIDNATFSLTTNLIVNGTLELNSNSCGVGTLSGNSILASGNVITTGSASPYVGTTVIRLVGSTSQTISMQGSTWLPNFEIASTGGTVSLIGTLRFRGPFTYTSGNVDATGTYVIFPYPANSTTALTPGPIVFQDVEYYSNCAGYDNNYINLSGTLRVSGNLTMNQGGCGLGRISGGTVTVGGNLLGTGSGASAIQSPLILNGTSAQTMTLFGSTQIQGVLTVDKSAGTLTLASAVAMTGGSQTLTLTNGRINMAGYNLTVGSTLAMASGTVIDTGCGTLRRNGSTVVPAGAWDQGTVLGGTASPNLSINDASVTEGSTATFTATLSAYSCTDITLDHATADGTATVANSDYTAIATTALTFTPGQTTKTITVVTTTDTTAESNETYSLNLTNVTGATLTDGTGVGTIVNDDTDPYMWTGTAGDGSWNTAGNWFGNAVPPTSSIAIFSNLCTNCAMNAATGNITIGGLRLDNGFTGTVSQPSGRTLTIGSGAFRQDGGVFVGSSSGDAISLSGTTSISGGTFTATTGTMTFNSDVTIGGSATFNHANGTVLFGNAWTAFTGTNVQFYNVRAVKTTTGRDLITNGSFTAQNELYISMGGSAIGSGTISVLGNVSNNSSTHGPNSTTVIRLAGSSQTITSNGSNGFPALEFASTGTVTLLGTVAVWRSFVRTSGVVDAGTSLVQLLGAANSPLSGNMSLNDVHYSKSGAGQDSLITDTLTVNGSLILDTNNTSLGAGTLIARGNVTINSRINVNTTGLLKIAGSGNQTIQSNGTTSDLANVEFVSTGTIAVLGTLSMFRNLTYTSGVIDLSNSTVRFGVGPGTVSNAGALAFNDVIIAKSGGNDFWLNGSMNVNGTFTYDPGGCALWTGTIYAKGNVVLSSNPFTTTTMAVRMTGTTGTQTLSGAGTIRNLTLAPAGSNIVLASNVSPANAMSVASGTLNMAGYNLTVANALSMASGTAIYTSCGTLRHNSTTVINPGAFDQGTVYGYTPTSLTINDPSVTEGSTLTFTASLNAANCANVTFNYATSDNTATTGDSDYSSSSSTATITAGQTTVDITVATTTDTKYEANETLNLSLSSVANSLVGDNSGVGTVTNDDSAPTVQFTAASQSVDENVGTATITAQLSAVSGLNAVIPFALTGSATGGGGANDYTDPTSPVTITAGQSTVNIAVAVNNDALNETAETVILTMGAATDATISGTTVHTLTINASDNLGTFNVTGITSASDSTKDANLNIDLRPVVNWERSTGATSYDVTVFEDDGTTVKCSTQTVADPGSGTEASFNFSGCSGGDLTVATFYKAKVVATDGSVTLDAANSLYRFYVNRAPVIGANPTGNGVWYVLSGGSLVIDAQHAASPATGVATDADSDTLTFSSVGTPSGGVGSTTNNSTSVTYSPGAYTGVDSFTFTVSDGRGGSVSGTMNIHVVTAFTWTGAAGDRDWATNGNWCGAINTNKTGCANTGVEPTSSATTSHIAIFDGTCTAAGSGCSPNTNANANYTMYGLRLNSGYSGTLTQVDSKAMTIGAGGYNQAAGSFVGASSGGPAQIYSTGAFVVSAGAITSTAGTLKVGNTFNIASSTFTHNSGAVRFTGGSNYNITTNGTTFNHVHFFMDAGGNHTLTIIDNFTVLGNVTIDKTIGNAPLMVYPSGSRTIDLHGNLSIAHSDNTNGITFGSSSLTFNLIGTADQTLTSTAWTNDFRASIAVNKPSGILKLASNFRVGGHFTLPSGQTFDTSPDGGTTVYNPAFGGNFTNAGTFTVRSSTVRFSAITNGTITTGGLTFNNVEFVGDGIGNLTLTLADNFTVNGNLTINKTLGNGSYNVLPSGARTIELHGNLTVSHSDGMNVLVFGSSALLINMVGAADQSLSSTAWAGDMRTSMTINKPSGIVKLAGNFRTAGHFTLPSGQTFDTSPDGGTTVYNPAFGGGFTNAGTFTLRSATVRFFGFLSGTITTNGLVFNNLEFIGDYASNSTVTIAENLTVNGNLTVDKTIGNAGFTITAATSQKWIYVAGNVSIARSDASNVMSFGHASYLGIELNGTGAQTITHTGGSFVGDLTINNTVGPVAQTTGFTMSGTGQDFLLQAGAYDMAGFSLNSKAMNLNTNTLTKNGGTLTVNSIVQGSGSILGGTVAP